MSTDQQVVEGQANPAAALGPDVKDGADQSGAQDSDVNVTTEPSQVEDVTQDSSPDQGVKSEEKPSIAERIRQGIDEITGKKDGKSEDSPAEDESTSGQEETASEQETSEETQEAAPSEEESDEEKNADKEWHKHPATQKVLEERKKARAERDSYKQQIDGLKPQAENYEKIQGFMKENDVSDKDAAQALQLTALSRQNPEKFYEQIVTLANQWGEHLGKVLPKDLRQEVENGYITRERAQELAKMRGESKRAQSEEDRARREAEQYQQQISSQQEHQYRQQLFTKWYDQAGKTDPEIDRKMDLITDRLHQIRAQEGDPKDVDDAWQRLDRAHSEVNSRIKQFQPKKAPVEPRPKSTGMPASQNAEPRNFQEAMDQGLNQVLGGK